MRIQQVRWCKKCEEILPIHCQKCIAHPERKPRIVELVGAPEILLTAPCGCVKLRCQRKTCIETMWRQLRKSGSTDFALKNHFCSKRCTAQATAEKKKTAQELPCSYPPCHKKRLVNVSELKTRLNIFCSGKCFHLNRIAENSKIRRLISETQSLACYSDRCHGEIVDHIRLPNKIMSCVRCNSRRDDKIKMPHIPQQLRGARD